MKQVINGKMYDTEKATLIGEKTYGNSSDVHYDYEALYVTKKKNYFLEYAGGALSKYAEKAGSNSWGGSNGLTWYTEEMAFEWAQEHAPSEEVQKHFSHLIQEA